MFELVRYLLDPLSLLLFLVFLGLGFRVMQAPSETRRRRIIGFIGYTFAVHLLVGVSQRDAWPFSPYPLMRGRWDENSTHDAVVFVGVDAAGREWPVDATAWAPVFPLVLQEWFYATFPRLTAEAKSLVAVYLHERAEQWRSANREGRKIGNDRLLGRFAAPDWWNYRLIVESAPTPFVKLRIYRTAWIPRDRYLDPSRVNRRVIYDTAEP